MEQWKIQSTKKCWKPWQSSAHRPKRWQPSAGKCIINFHIIFQPCLCEQEKPQHSWGFGFSIFFPHFWEFFVSVAMQVPPNTCSCKQKQQQQWSLVVNFSQVTASFVQYFEAGFLLFDFSFYYFRGGFHSLTCRDRYQVQAGKCLESLTFLAVLCLILIFFSFLFFGLSAVT